MMITIRLSARRDRSCESCQHGVSRYSRRFRLGKVVFRLGRQRAMAVFGHGTVTLDDVYRWSALPPRTRRAVLSVILAHGCASLRAAGKRQCVGRVTTELFLPFFQLLTPRRCSVSSRVYRMIGTHGWSKDPGRGRGRSRRYV